MPLLSASAAAHSRRQLAKSSLCLPFVFESACLRFQTWWDMNSKGSGSSVRPAFLLSMTLFFSALCNFVVVEIRIFQQSYLHSLWSTNPADGRVLLENCAAKTLEMVLITATCNKAFVLSSFSTMAITSNCIKSL